MPEQGGRGGGGHAVLAGAGLGDQAGLAHALGPAAPGPSTLLILCEPVWLRSSRLSSIRTPSSSRQPVALGERRRSAGVVAQQVVELGAEAPGRPRPRGTRPRARGRPAPASRGRTGRRTRRSGRRRWARPGTIPARLGRSERALRTRSAASAERHVVFPVVNGVGRRRSVDRRRSRRRSTALGSSSSAASLAALMNRMHLRARPCGPGGARRRSTRRRPRAAPGATASATFSGVRPPARITRRSSGSRSASAQSKTWPEPGVRPSRSGWRRPRRTRRPGRACGSPAAKAWIRNCTRSRIHSPSAGVSWPCSCTRAEPGGVDHLDHPLGRLVAEHADGHDLGRQPADDVAGLGRRRSGGATGANIEPDRVGAHGHREQGVLLVGDAADLHEHRAATVPARAEPVRLVRSSLVTGRRGRQASIRRPCRKSS